MEQTTEDIKRQLDIVEQQIKELDNKRVALKILKYSGEKTIKIKWKYTQKMINRVINQVSLYDVVNDLFITPIPFKNKKYFYLKTTPFDWNRNLKGRPFFLSTNKRRFKCFETGLSGNVINFVMYFMKINKKDAISYLALKYNITKDIVRTDYYLGNDDSSDLPF